MSTQIAVLSQGFVHFIQTLLQTKLCVKISYPYLDVRTFTCCPRKLFLPNDSDGGECGVWRGSRSSKDGWAPSETESGIQIQVCVFSLQILRLSALCGQIWQIFWGVMTLGRQVKSSPNFSSFGQQRAEKRNIWRGKHTNLNLNSGLCSEKKEMPVLDAELLWELL